MLPEIRLGTSMKQKNKRYKLNKENVRPFEGMCGTVWELINPRNTPVKNVNLTIVVVNPKKEAEEHYHKMTEELYYVIKGKGYVKIGQDTYTLKEGDAIYIPPGKPHKLINKSDLPLEVLVVNSPPYSPDDTFSVEKILAMKDES